MPASLELKARFGKRGYTSSARAYQSFAMELADSWKDSFEVVKKELRLHIEQVAREVAEGDTFVSRTGEGKNQILKSPFIEGSNFSNLGAGFRLSGYMVYHEKGGTKSAGSKLLTIPLKAALNSKGVPLKQSARNWKNTFVARSKAGNLLIFQKRGSGIIPLYVLKESVKITARLGLGAKVQQTLPRFLSKAADKIAREFMK